jgi:hypothetical protein
MLDSRVKQGTIWMLCLCCSSLKTDSNINRSRNSHTLHPVGDHEALRASRASVGKNLGPQENTAISLAKKKLVKYLSFP